MSSYKHSAPSKSKGGAFLAVAAGLVLVLAVVCFVLMQGGNKIGDVAVLDNVLTDLDRNGLQGAVERIIDQNPITEEIGVFFLSETYTIKAEQIDLVYDADVMAENAWKAGQRSVLERLLGSKEVLPVAQPAVKWDG